MKRRTLLGALGGAVALGGGYLGVELFAPERATREETDLTGGSTPTAGSGGASGATPTAESTGGTGETGFAPAGGDGGGGAGTPQSARRTASGSATVLKRGEFVGKDGHECSGTVELARDDEGYFLQFRNYEQTQGPDVYCYLTPAEDPDTSAEIDAGTKVLIDGGADGGEMTKVGTFPQRLPDGLDLTGMRGVGIWCENFAVPFGAATLEEV